MTDYIAIIHKEDDSDFGVSFPDFPGCVSAGETLEEARRMATEALAGHIACMIENGEEVPPPSSLDAVMEDAVNREGVAILVAAPKQASRTVRINVTMPEEVLHAVDVAARAAGATRSGFLTRAARKALPDAPR